MDRQLSIPFLLQLLPQPEPRLFICMYPFLILVQARLTLIQDQNPYHLQYDYDCR